MNDSRNDNAGIVEHTKSAANIRTDVSNRERINRWVAGVNMFKDQPLIGFGPGTYQFVYIPYQNPQFMTRLSVTDQWNIPENSGGTAHSEYVLALSEMGLIGLSGLLIFIGRLIWVSLMTFNQKIFRLRIIISFAVLSTYLFHAFFNNFLNTDKFAFLFWGTAAWLFANFENDKNEVEENSNPVT